MFKLNKLLEVILEIEGVEKKIIVEAPSVEELPNLLRGKIISCKELDFLIGRGNSLSTKD